MTINSKTLHVAWSVAAVALLALPSVTLANSAIDQYDEAIPNVGGEHEPTGPPPATGSGGAEGDPAATSGQTAQDVTSVESTATTQSPAAELDDGAAGKSKASAGDGTDQASKKERAEDGESASASNLGIGAASSSPAGGIGLPLLIGAMIASLIVVLLARRFGPGRRSAA